MICLIWKPVLNKRNIQYYNILLFYDIFVFQKVLRSFKVILGSLKGLAIRMILTCFVSKNDFLHQNEFFVKKWPLSFKNQSLLSENDHKIINCAKIQPFSDLKWPAYSTNEILTKFSTKLHNREILEKMSTKIWTFLYFWTFLTKNRLFVAIFKFFRGHLWQFN